MIETGLGSEVDKFLNDISSTEDNAEGKLGSSAKSYKPGFVWFQKFLSEQSLKESSQFKRVKNIPAFFTAVRLGKKIDVATDKKFPDRAMLKQYVIILELNSSLQKLLEAMFVLFNPFSTFTIYPLQQATLISLLQPQRTLSLLGAFSKLVTSFSLSIFLCTDV